MLTFIKTLGIAIIYDDASLGILFVWDDYDLIKSLARGKF